MIQQEPQPVHDELQPAQDQAVPADSLQPVVPSSVGPSSTATPDTKGSKRSPQSMDTPSEAEEKKTCPEGMGGPQAKAMDCNICHRPRAQKQHGKTCPTCLRIMRKAHGIRSSQVVLGNPDLKSKVQDASLKESPVKSEEDNPDLQDQISELQKLLKRIKRTAG